MELVYGMFTLPDPLLDDEVVNGIRCWWMVLAWSLLPA